MAKLDDPGNTEPAAASASSMSRSGALLASVLSAALAALILGVAARMFRDAYIRFGIELPLLSRAVLEWHLLAWVLPACVLAAWCFWPRPRQRRLATLVLGLGSLLVVLPLCLLLLYLPYSSAEAW